VENTISFDGFLDMLLAVQKQRQAGQVVSPDQPDPAPDQDGLIVLTAVKHRLPVVLVRAMAAHESAGGITCACRFEQDFYDCYLKGKTPDFRPEHCSWDTERIGRATSWGLMQVMGETARCNGFRGWFPELCQPAAGLEWGCLYLRRLADRYLADSDWPTVMRAYNGGPGNRDNEASPYPGLILAHIPGGVWPDKE
jgi:hypothetical protein